ncbi:hypothetical protein KOR34_36360 [Posidoniimonas corsicana]|uniref:Glutamine amidotransferase domain-containing protein n=2 Tax=Posidoniimonas corsicana TaxID=1938618 RepID=A0A5C5V7S5_9BACT|nr:hypothetical protein KOR34_36360 [Posidoniimonas corsicana]
MGDDWALSDFAFDSESGAGYDLTESIATFFSPNVGGEFLAISDAPPVIPFGRRGVSGIEVADAMRALGHSWTADPEVEFTLANLLHYDAVFLTGTLGTTPAASEVLTQYVMAGGGVLVMGGSGEFGAAMDEAQAWAPFLGQFGLYLGDAWFGGSQGSIDEIAIDTFEGGAAEAVEAISWSQGQLASVADEANPRTRVALRGDFSAVGGGPQGQINDVMAVYHRPFIAGDFNDDSVVDAADYTVWRDAHGHAVVLPGDPTAGGVDQADYLVWRANYGFSEQYGPGTAASPSPEPSAFLCIAGLTFSWGVLVRGGIADTRYPVSKSSI